MPKVLSWDFSEYVPSLSQIKELHSDEEIMEEYKRLRKLANERLRKISKSEFANTQIYKSNVGAFPAPSALDKKSLAPALASVARFTQEKLSTVGGLRAKRRKDLATLSKHGYNIKQSEYAEFTEYMDDIYARLKSKQYDSDQIVKVFEFGKKWKIPEKELYRDFEQYYNSRKKLDSFEPNVRAKTWKSAKVREAFDQWYEAKG